MKRVIILLCIILLITSITTEAETMSNDTLPPFVLSEMPVSGQNDIPIETNISIHLNEEIEKGINFNKISLTNNENKKVIFTASVLGSNIAITLKERLIYEKEYTLTLPEGAVIDKAGNPLVKACMIKFKIKNIILAMNSDFKSITEGIKKIAVSYPGALETLSDAWIPIASSGNVYGNTLFSAARKYGNGRILAIGKEDIMRLNNIYPLDNLKFLKNSIKWLNGSGKKQIAYSTGHGEVIDNIAIENLKKELEKDGYTVSGTNLTAEQLKNKDIVIIGNAWMNFSNAEIDTIKNFVKDGGGLIIAGLGWSFKDYNPDRTYPMDMLGAPFEIKWAKSIIYETSEKYKDYSVFNVIYPNTGIESSIASVSQPDILPNSSTALESPKKGVNVYLDGNLVTAKDSSGNYAEPIVYNGTIYLPAGKVADMMGKKYTWDKNTNSAYITNKPVETNNTAEVVKEITVSSAQELYDAIGSYRKILLKPGVYDLSKITASRYSNTSGGHKYLTPRGQVVIEDVKNLTIEGVGDRYVEIRTASTDNAIFEFDDSNDITLKNIRAGHTPSEYKCENGVLIFNQCKNINILKSELYGCGSFGIRLENSQNANMIDSVITECSWTSMFIIKSKNVVFKSSKINNHACYSSLIQISDSYDILFSNCDITNNIILSRDDGKLFSITNSINVKLEDSKVNHNIMQYFTWQKNDLSTKNVVFEDNKFIAGMYGWE